MEGSMKTKDRNWKNHKFFHLVQSGHRDNQLNILKLLKGIRANNLLDIGCSDGSFTIECAMTIGAKKLYGIEIAEEEAKKARSKGIEVFVRDASDVFPFPDEYFEVIVSNQVLEHVRDVDSVLRESKRSLRRNGVFILSTPNLCSLLQRLLVLWGQQPTTLHVSDIQVGNFLSGVYSGGHIHAFSPSALRDLARYHGFKIEKFVGVGFYPFGTRLAGILSRINRNYSVYLTLVAKK
jgi:2-polyprenyl-3-methyl-5-hydroxy-6-metoxy-1,4-benzoquinol methylase